MRSLRPILLSWLWILVTANNENDLETIDLLENQNGTTVRSPKTKTTQTFMNIVICRKSISNVAVPIYSKKKGSSLP